MLIVDEAHLSKPFLDTLGWVERYQGEPWQEQRVAPGLRFVQMSATVGEAGEKFELDAADYSSERLIPRLEAEKRADLKECGNVAQSAVEEVLRLADGGAQVVGVVLNTVAAARAVYEQLKGKGEAILLTGRIRPYDRDVLLAEYLKRMEAGRIRESGRPLFVAATQTVEVGADLDFDGLVTEAAALDALLQRFGRLNRLGISRSAPAVILKPKGGKEKDWVYGEATEETWKWLNEFASTEAGGRWIDFGVKRMGELVARESRAGLTVDKGTALSISGTRRCVGADQSNTSSRPGRGAISAWYGGSGSSGRADCLACGPGGVGSGRLGVDCRGGASRQHGSPTVAIRSSAAVAGTEGGYGRRCGRCGA
jgi:CRISPR-associated endonuclease/helicase Cas3